MNKLKEFQKEEIFQALEWINLFFNFPIEDLKLAHKNFNYLLNNQIIDEKFEIIGLGCSKICVKISKYFCIKILKKNIFNYEQEKYLKFQKDFEDLFIPSTFIITNTDIEIKEELFKKELFFDNYRIKERFFKKSCFILQPLANIEINYKDDVIPLLEKYHIQLSLPLNPLDSIDINPKNWGQINNKLYLFDW